MKKHFVANELLYYYIPKIPSQKLSASNLIFDLNLENALKSHFKIDIARVSLSTRKLYFPLHAPAKVLPPLCKLVLRHVDLYFSLNSYHGKVTEFINADLV